MTETVKSAGIKRDMKYDDMLYLPHPEPKNHKRMSMHDRAAQFAPFAALTGYGEAVKETERIVDKKRELTDEEKENIDYALRNLKNNPYAEIEYFLPDKTKNGGKYETYRGKVISVSAYEKILITESGIKIPFDNLLSVQAVEED